MADLLSIFGDDDSEPVMRSAEEHDYTRGFIHGVKVTLSIILTVGGIITAVAKLGSAGED